MGSKPSDTARDTDCCDAGSVKNVKRMNSLTLEPVGFIRSTVKGRADAPRQGGEGAPDAWLEVEPRFGEALLGIEVGHELIVITWLHEAKRDVLKGHPRNDQNRPLTGVFSTRSPARPNPLGLHPVTVREIDGTRVRVGPLEAFDGTPVVDIKSASTGTDEWRSHMKPVQGHYFIKPEDVSWRPSNLMKIPNADYLERTGSENLGARLWRLPPGSANTLHRHIRSEEFYFVLAGTGRLRVGEESLTVPKYGGVLVRPDQLRQVFNDTDEEVLWLIVGAPEEVEFLRGSKSQLDLSLIYPVDPKQLPPELAGVEWPPNS